VVNNFTTINSSNYNHLLLSASKSAATEQNKSALTDHAISLNNVTDWNHAKVIDRESNRMVWWIREAIHIRKEQEVDELRREVLSTSTHL